MEAIANAWHVWDKKVATTTFSVLKAINWDIHPISPVTKDWTGVEAPRFC